MSKIEPIAMTIDIDKYEGSVPNGYDLVVYEKGEEEWLGTDASLKVDGPLQIMIYGWDEVGHFDNEFEKPAYAFVKN